MWLGYVVIILFHQNMNPTYSACELAFYSPSSYFILFDRLLSKDNWIPINFNHKVRKHEPEYVALDLNQVEQIVLLTPMSDILHV